MWKSPRILFVAKEGFGKEEEKEIEEKCEKMSCYFLEKDEKIEYGMVRSYPNVIISVGAIWYEYGEILGLAQKYKNKWIHYEEKEKINVDEIYYCYLTMTKNEKLPVMSIITSTYKSEHKVWRAFTSLKNSRYTNWEWIIMDDSDDEGKTFEMLKTMENMDSRVRIYKRSKHTGVIGELKHDCSCLARGEIIVELDHDDELTENCLDLLVEAYLEYPDAGFYYTDCAELFEFSNAPFTYGEFWGLGYGSYYAQKYKDKTLYVARSPDINPKTIRYIVSAPNHVRAWKKTFYQKIYGHNTDLPVSDDYELVVRSFLHTKIVKIPFLGYLQYRNQSGNTTFNRIEEITKLQSLISCYYNNQISQRFQELQIPQDCLYVQNCPIWKKDFLLTEPYANYTYRKDLVSIVVPTFNRPNDLIKAINSILSQTYTNYEILIIGDHCPVLDSLTSHFNDPRIKWWNLWSNANDFGATPRNYALKCMASGKYIAYLDDDNFWHPNHLESLVTTLKSSNSSFAFSSFFIDDYTVICRLPKLGRIDTSCILHHYSLLDKYGYWNTTIYTHDFDLVSRWISHNESYSTSLLPTVYYKADPSRVSAKYIYELYDDQVPPPSNSNSSLPNPPIDSLPNSSVESLPNLPIDPLPNSSIESLPNLPIDPLPNSSIDPLPNSSIDSPPNSSIDSPPNSSIYSPPNSSIYSPPNLLIDPLPNSSIDSLSLSSIDDTTDDIKSNKDKSNYDGSLKDGVQSGVEISNISSEVLNEKIDNVLFICAP